MIWPRLSLALILVTLSVFEIQGCRGSANVEMPPDSAAAQFLQAYVDAHNRKDLEAEKALVDWDDITEQSREHCLRETIEYDVKTRIASAKIEEIPGLTPRFAARYNIPPDKFLLVVYADSRGLYDDEIPHRQKRGPLLFRFVRPYARSDAQK